MGGATRSTMGLGHAARSTMGGSAHEVGEDVKFLWRSTPALKQRAEVADDGMVGIAVAPLRAAGTRPTRPTDAPRVVPGQATMRHWRVFKKKFSDLGWNIQKRKDDKIGNTSSVKRLAENFKVGGASQ